MEADRRLATHPDRHQGLMTWPKWSHWTVDLSYDANSTPLTQPLFCQVFLGEWSTSWNQCQWRSRKTFSCWTCCTFVATYTLCHLWGTTLFAVFERHNIVYRHECTRRSLALLRWFIPGFEWGHHLRSFWIYHFRLAPVSIPSISYTH